MAVAGSSVRVLGVSRSKWKQLRQVRSSVVIEHWVCLYCDVIPTDFFWERVKRVQRVLTRQAKV